MCLHVAFTSWSFQLRSVLCEAVWCRPLHNSGVNEDLDTCIEEATSLDCHPNLPLSVSYKTDLREFERDALKELSVNKMI